MPRASWRQRSLRGAKRRLGNRPTLSNLTYDRRDTFAVDQSRYFAGPLHEGGAKHVRLFNQRKERGLSACSYACPPSQRGNVRSEAMAVRGRSLRLV